MKILKIIPLLSIVVLLLVGCTSTPKTKMVVEGAQSLPLNFAKSFTVDTIGQTSILTVLNSNDSNQVLDKWVLRPQSYAEPLQANEIKVPCRRIICLSSTQLAYLIELDALDHVVGINSSRHLFNETIKERVSEHKIGKVGKEGIFNIESIISLNPDVIFVSPFKSGGYDALRNLGIPLVSMAAYGESTPLGRAEWIKMLALFTGQSAKADTLYNDIEKEYLHLKELASTVNSRPTILSGKMKGGAWYVPGGQSFFAHYFRDAGADYIIKNNKTGAQPMDYESIYSLGHDADYWRLLTSSPAGFNKAALKAEDVRYTDFNAYKTGNILVCNLREVPYREESCVKPQVLLADYIHHFHPHLLPDYKPYYWKKINE